MAKPPRKQSDQSPVAQGILVLAQKLRLDAAKWEANPDPEESYADGLRAAAAELEAFANS